MYMLHILLYINIIYIMDYNMYIYDIYYIL